MPGTLAVFAVVLAITAIFGGGDGNITIGAGIEVTACVDVTAARDEVAFGAEVDVTARTRGAAYVADKVGAVAAVLNVMLFVGGSGEGNVSVGTGDEVASGTDDAGSGGNVGSGAQDKVGTGFYAGG